ncbi:hypothetical protein IFM47457_01144 [Aspergillus lentulus]|nr:hypothetical protein IFM47457_01144 [Aspergillus lentulus]
MIQVIRAGSSLATQQFLTFRILWRPHTNIKNIGEPHAPIKKVEVKDTAEISKENKRFSHSFEAYLQSIKDKGDTSGKLTRSRGYVD